MVKPEKYIQKRNFWKGFVYACILFAATYLIYDLFVSGVQLENLGTILGRIGGLIILFLVFKYMPGIGEIKVSSDLSPKDAKIITWISGFGCFIFIMWFILIILLTVYKWDVNSLVALLPFFLSLIIINSSVFYFWHRIKSKLFIIFGIVATVLILGFLPFHYSIFPEKISQIITLVSFFTFIVGGLIGFAYNFYVLLKYVTPQVKPYGSKKTWAEIYKSEKK